MLGAGKLSLKAAISLSRIKAGVPACPSDLPRALGGKAGPDALWLPPGAIEWEAAGT